jgi:hypothetical protein
MLLCYDEQSKFEARRHQPEIRIGKLLNVLEICAGAQKSCEWICVKQRDFGITNGKGTGSTTAFDHKSSTTS